MNFDIIESILFIKEVDIFLQNSLTDFYHILYDEIAIQYHLLLIQYRNHKLKDSIEFVGDSLKEIKCLEIVCVNFSRNIIQIEGINKFLINICKLENLRVIELDFGENQISFDQEHLNLTVLSKFQMLHKLKLRFSNNFIRAKLIQQIEQLTSSLPNLLAVKFHLRQIKKFQEIDDAMDSLVLAIVKKPKLIDVELDYAGSTFIKNLRLIQKRKSTFMMNCVFFDLFTNKVEMKNASKVSQDILSQVGFK